MSHTGAGGPVHPLSIICNLSERGVYGCEDIHCSYWRTHEGGYRRADTFMEFAKGLTDRLQDLVFELQSNFIDFARSTYGIFFYPDLVVIEKRPMNQPSIFKWGNNLHDVRLSC